MLTPADMEDAFQNIDRRLTTVEQILPTLATKQDLERFATKNDLERFATKADLKEGIAEAKQHANVLFEALVDRMGLLAEAVASLHDDVHKIAATLASVATKADDTSVQLRMLIHQLRRRGVI